VGTPTAAAGMKWVMIPQDDGELWSAVAGGDPDAFGLLFERHGRSIYNYCFRRTGDWARAEDLTSIVFLECWRRRDIELAGDKVLPWLFGIATNVCRSRRRSVARHRAALGRLPAPDRALDFADEALDRLADEVRMRNLLALVARLPKREQDVLALCVWADLSYRDAAAALGIPVGTVRSRLARARARLEELVASTADKSGGGALTDVLAEGAENDAR
jgi:RNA polymerase sigma factor (sigma-70 family)